MCFRLMWLGVVLLLLLETLTVVHGKGKGSGGGSGGGSSSKKTRNLTPAELLPACSDCIKFTDSDLAKPGCGCEMGAEWFDENCQAACQ